MNHEQVRSWILEGESTDAVISRMATEHLADCTECRAFAAQWAGVRQALEARPAAMPGAGFEKRWVERLRVARRLRHRRQTALALACSGLGATATLAVMGWWVLGAPAQAVGIVLGQLAALDAQLRLVVDSLRIVSSALPPLASFGLMWAGMAVALGLIMLYTGFSALWTASFYLAVLQTQAKEN